jgi:SAM-dependent methyltransferase
MNPLIYGELAPSWYRLMTPPGEYVEEAAVYVATLQRAASTPPETLLELGAGAGHNAVHMKAAFRACVLTDLSPEMLALSRELNPDCEHCLGDMRALRLDRTFDAVFVHDAVTYMTTEADLLAAARTAFVHTRPGGVALFAVDAVKETFVEDTELLEGDDGQRSLRCTMWSWDPDPTDDTCLTEFGFLLREGGEVRAVHDRHVEGLFADAAWVRVLTAAGFDVSPREAASCGGELYVCRRGR